MNGAKARQRGRPAPPPRHGQEQRNAALSGALSAFGRTQSSSSLLATPGALQGPAVSRTATRSPGKPAAVTREAAPSSAASRRSSVQLHQTISAQPRLVHTESSSTISPLSRQSTSQSLPQGIEPGSAPLSGPSNISTALAAARFAGLAKTRSHPAPQIPLPSPDAVDESHYLPSSGTVQGVKRWLESLDGDHPPDHGSREQSPQRASLESQLREGLLGPALPRLDTNVASTHQDTKKNGSATTGSTLTIKSPKPIRPRVRSATLAGESGEVTPVQPLLPDAFSSQDSANKINSLQEDVLDDSNTASNASEADLHTYDGIDNSSKENVPDEAAAFGSGSKPIDIPGTRQRIHRSSTAPATPPQFTRRPSAQSSMPTRSSPVPGLLRTATTGDAGDSMRIDALANSMVASHLALHNPLARLSPSKSPNPLSRARDKARTPFQHFKQQDTGSKSKFARTPSPVKAFQYTLRRDTSSSASEDDNPYERRRNKKKRFIHKHPNKHREGDRDRWKDVLTERERKRYEGLWAANRGIHLGFTAKELRDTSTAALEAARTNVSNLVVRDIWSRSRLPTHILAEVWDLVDKKQLGRLEKEEFVVGLWLIDQRLKGRKLPLKVGESVWRSVTGIYGLNVK